MKILRFFFATMSLCGMSVSLAVPRDAIEIDAIRYLEKKSVPRFNVYLDYTAKASSTAGIGIGCLIFRRDIFSLDLEGANSISREKKNIAVSVGGELRAFSNPYQSGTYVNLNSKYEVINENSSSAWIYGGGLGTHFLAATNDHLWLEANILRKPNSNEANVFQFRVGATL